MQIPILPEAAHEKADQRKNDRRPRSMEKALPERLRAPEIDDGGHPSRFQHPIDFTQSRRYRIQIPEHIRTKDSIHRRITQRELLALTDDPSSGAIKRQHLGSRVNGNDHPIAKIRIGRPGPSTKVDHTSAGKVLDGTTAPIVIAPQRENPVDPVVTTGNPGKDFPTGHGPMTSVPRKPRSGSGTVTDPSAC